MPDSLEYNLHLTSELDDMQRDAHRIIDYLTSTKDEVLFQKALEQLKSFEKLARQKHSLNRNLSIEIRSHLASKHNANVDSLAECPLYTILPPELRQRIFSFVIPLASSIHVSKIIDPTNYKPYNLRDLGFRFWLCRTIDLDWSRGVCKCSHDRWSLSTTYRPDTIDNTLFLISRVIRREALDLFFTHNTFTFLSLQNLQDFTYNFRTSSSKIQSVRLFHHTNDHKSGMEYKDLPSSRARLSSLKKLDLHLYLSDSTPYDQYYEDRFCTQLILFALGPCPKHHREYVGRNGAETHDSDDRGRKGRDTAKISAAEPNGSIEGTSIEENSTTVDKTPQMNTLAGPEMLQSLDKATSAEHSAIAPIALFGQDFTGQSGSDSQALPRQDSIVETSHSDLPDTVTSITPPDEQPHTSSSTNFVEPLDPIVNSDANQAPKTEPSPQKSFWLPRAPSPWTPSSLQSFTLKIHPYPHSQLAHGQKSFFNADQDSIFARVHDHLTDVFLNRISIEDDGNEGTANSNHNMKRKYTCYKDVPKIMQKPKRLDGARWELSGMAKRGTLVVRD